MDLGGRVYRRRKDRIKTELVIRNKEANDRYKPRRPATRLTQDDIIQPTNDSCRHLHPHTLLSLALFVFDFATGRYENDLAERYVRALCREISKWNEIENPSRGRDDLFWRRHASLLAPAQIERILEAVQERFEVSSMTRKSQIELNPRAWASQSKYSPQRRRERGGVRRE